MKVPKEAIERALARAARSSRVQEIAADWLETGFFCLFLGRRPSRSRIQNRIRNISGALYVASMRYYTWEKIKSSYVTLEVDGFTFIAWPAPPSFKEKFQQEQETE